MEEKPEFSQRDWDVVCGQVQPDPASVSTVCAAQELLAVDSTLAWPFFCVIWMPHLFTLAGFKH